MLCTLLPTSCSRCPRQNSLIVLASWLSSEVCTPDFSLMQPLPKFLRLPHLPIALPPHAEWLHPFTSTKAIGNARGALPQSYLCVLSPVGFAMSRSSFWTLANSLNHKSTQASPPGRATFDYATGIKIPLYLKVSHIAVHCSVTQGSFFHASYTIPSLN